MYRSTMLRFSLRKSGGGGVETDRDQSVSGSYKHEYKFSNYMNIWKSLKQLSNYKLYKEESCPCQ